MREYYLLGVLEGRVSARGVGGERRRECLLGALEGRGGESVC
jgi:hypothetical protein